MSCNIFTYGSLMFPGVWTQVVRKPYQSVKAVLVDHARFAIANETYPGMVARQGASVEGVLYLEVDAEDLARLDAFEGQDYRRATVCVQWPGGLESEAQTYLYTSWHGLLTTAWQAEEFDLQRFLHTYCKNN